MVTLIFLGNPRFCGRKFQICSQNFPPKLQFSDFMIIIIQMGYTEFFSGRFVTQSGDFYHCLRFYTVWLYSLLPPYFWSYISNMWSNISPQALIFPPRRVYDNHHPNERYKSFLSQMFSSNRVIFTRSNVYHPFCVVSLADRKITLKVFSLLIPSALQTR